MGSSAPSVPVYDPFQVANAQAGLNLQTAEEQQAASEVGQVTPFGSLTYQQTGVGPNGIPLTTATTQLSPQEQFLLSIGQGTQAEAGVGANELLGRANYGGSNPLADIGSMTSGLTGQMLGQETSYLSPYFSQQTEALQSQLANQGLTPTDPAYKTAMNNLMQSQNQSVTGFLAQAEPQAFGQAESLYNLPLTTAESLFSVGAPASLATNLINTPTASVPSTNLVGAVAAAQQAQIANANLQEQQFGGMLSGIGSLGAALLA